MNSKQCKRIRQSMRSAGLDPRQCGYVSYKRTPERRSARLPNEPVPEKAEQRLIDRDQGRFAYKFFKRNILSKGGAVTTDDMVAMYLGSIEFKRLSKSYTDEQSNVRTDARKAYGEAH